MESEICVLFPLHNSMLSNDKFVSHIVRTHYSIFGETKRLFSLAARMEQKSERINIDFE